MLLTSNFVESFFVATLWGYFWSLGLLDSLQNPFLIHYMEVLWPQIWTLYHQHSRVSNGLPMLLLVPSDSPFHLGSPKNSVPEREGNPTGHFLPHLPYPSVPMGTLMSISSDYSSKFSVPCSSSKEYRCQQDTTNAGTWYSQPS